MSGVATYWKSPYADDGRRLPTVNVTSHPITFLAREKIKTHRVHPTKIVKMKNFSHNLKYDEQSSLPVLLMNSEGSDMTSSSNPTTSTEKQLRGILIKRNTELPIGINMYMNSIKIGKRVKFDDKVDRLRQISKKYNTTSNSSDLNEISWMQAPSRDSDNESSRQKSVKSRISVEVHNHLITPRQQNLKMTRSVTCPTFTMPRKTISRNQARRPSTAHTPRNVENDVSELRTDNESSSMDFDDRINFCDELKTNRILQWLEHMDAVQSKEGHCTLLMEGIHADDE